MTKFATFNAFWPFWPISLLLAFIQVVVLPSFSSSCPSNLLIQLPLSKLAINPSPNSLLVEYSPPRGFPPSPFILANPRPSANSLNSSEYLQIPINGTWPSVGYSIRIHSIGHKNVTIFRQIVYSSPGKPILISIAASHQTCTLVYSPPSMPYSPQGHGHQHFTFHLEYFPVDLPSTVFFVRTNSTSVRLRKLVPGTQYRLSLFAEFFSIRSICPLELTFRTKIAKLPTQNNNGTTTKMPEIGGKKEEEENNKGVFDLEEEENNIHQGENVGLSVRGKGKEEMGGIRIDKIGKEMLELAWDLPELVPCDAFLVSHNSSNGGNGQMRTSNPGAQIPLQMGKIIQVNISCLFENTISPQWSANRLLDLRSPSPIRSVRLVQSSTDEFFRSSVILGIGLPSFPNFQFYQLQIGWALGKKVVGHQSQFFTGEQINQNEERGEGLVNISGLEPARLYTFSVRNVSREMGSLLSSAPIGLRLTTPPIITSTLDAGKIGTHSININFGESDPEHPFDHYELHFGANYNGKENKTEDGNVAIRKLAKHDPKSLTFGKLIPGKTYRFSLFTVLQGIRSRPVIALITTYPLKVSSLRPLIGPGFVLLFWTVQNPAQNECRFRLSYTASAGPHLHRAVSVELNGLFEWIIRELCIQFKGTTLRHRFGGLVWNTFYTFTITVIMGPDGAEAESESESVTIGMASKPRTIPLLQRYGSRELLLTFQNDQNAFSDRNGVAQQFAIIVAQQIEGTPEQVGDVWELPGWHDVRERAAEEDDQTSCWDAFRASPSEYNPFKRKNPPKNAQFLIGSEDCAAERRRLDEPFCNGPLRAQTDYWVKVRAYTVAGIAMETEWVGVNGNVPLSAAEMANKEEAEEREKRRRFPCYLYLNGCNNGCDGILSRRWKNHLILLLTTLMILLGA